jgi:hypothetical protein
MVGSQWYGPSHPEPAEVKADPREEVEVGQGFQP